MIPQSGKGKSRRHKKEKQTDTVWSNKRAQLLYNFFYQTNCVIIYLLYFLCKKIK